MTEEAPTPRLHSTPLLAGALIAMAAACMPARQPTDGAVLGRLATAKQVVFAYELAPTCALEAAANDEPPVATAAWSKVGPNELAHTQATVVDRATHLDERGVTRMLRIRDASGKSRWLRNVPTPTTKEVDRRWSCAVDLDAVAPHVKAVSAVTVRLMPNAPSCTSVTPVLGDAADVTFEPYTIVGRRLLRTAAGLAAAVTLASADFDRVLTLSASDLDTCFAVTKRAPLPSDARASVEAWLAEPSAPPPASDLPVYLQTAGLDEGTCLGEGSGPTRHDECRAAPFGVGAGGAGALGLQSLRFFRERVTDAVHAYGGKLAPAEELAGVNVHVRQVRGAGDVAGAFSRTMLASMLDAPKQKARSEHGYRLVRNADVSNGTTANVTLDIDVTYAFPKLDTTTQERRQRRARGKTNAANPELASIARRIDAARAASARADGEVAMYQGLFAVPLPRCEGASAIACDLAARKDIGSVRAAKRRARVDALEAIAKKVAPTTEQDDIATIDYRAKVHRRQGDATVTLKLTPTEASPGTVPVQITRKVPFEATEVEIAADAAKGIDAKAARPPEQPQVDAAVAAALLGEIDHALTVWMRRATASVAPAAFEPGSRAQLALFARWAAANRRVKLFSDLTEDRSELLAGGQAVEYPIAIPEGNGRCWAFVAVPTRSAVDVNLALRIRDTGALVARDGRTAFDASFEACPPPGRYVLQLWTPAGAAAGPISVGMFETTPGIEPDADYGAVIPSSMRARHAASSPVPAAPAAPTLR